MTKRNFFDLRFSLLIASHIVTAALVIFLIADGRNPTRHSEVNSGPWRDLAAKLHAAGIPEQAAHYYEKYLESNQVSEQVKANIAYSLGEIWEEQEQFKKAIGWFYLVNMYDPKSTNSQKADKKIVALLEKMQKFAAAKQALAQQTSLNVKESSDSPEGAVAVAKIGNKHIYRHQVQEALDSLPPHLQKNFETAEHKEKFLQKYVADELLYSKALRLNYLEDSQIKKQISQLTKQILVQKVINEEVSEKVTIDENDLQNYFKANQQKYRKPAQVTASQIKVKSKKLANDIANQLASGKMFKDLAKQHSLDDKTNSNGGKINQPIWQGKPFSGHSRETTDAIFRTQKGKWTKPLLSQGAYYIFQVNDKNPEVMPSFEKVAEQVRFDYKQNKSQNLYQQLMTATLGASDVKLYPERM